MSKNFGIRIRSKNQARVSILLLALGVASDLMNIPLSHAVGPQDSKTFTNPFANTGKQNFFDDDEGDDEDIPSSPPPPRGALGNNPGVMGGGAGGSPNQGNISLGGTPGGGVVSHKDIPNITLDSETGGGTKDSKEIVRDFNFPDNEIMEIAKALGKLTGKSFIYDKEVKGRISIISNGAITVGDAWRAFLTALDMNGFALIPSGQFLRIARQRDARDKQLKTYTGDFSPDTDALITRVFPLKYINAEEVARTFRSFMPANSRIIPYEQTNTVIVTDTGSNIAKLSKMLDLLDVEGYDAGIEVIPVKYASASELSKLIDTLIPGTGGAGGPPGAPRFAPGGKFSARRTKEGGIINTIISDERTNTLIVHANGKGADQVRELVAKLDRKLPPSIGGGKIHVIYLQFADAEKLSQTLNNLSQGAGAANRPMSPGGFGGTGFNPVQATLFEGNIKIAADVATNSLVITASPTDFATIQRVVSRLDIPRDEVYVEVVIMEMTINRSSQLAANIINAPSGIASLPSTDLFAFLQSQASQTGAILGFAAGNKYNLDLGSGKSIAISSVTGLIKALQTNANANILATPQVIALDNQDALFESTENVPVLKSVAVQGAIQTNTENQKVTLSIKLKPQINKLSNFVKLDIETKIGDFSATALPPEVAKFAKGTIDRNAKTVVVVGDGDTIVIGGLTRDKITDQVNKVPILGDIPILGWLFKSKSSDVAKSNLMIFMTPHIVRQYEKVRAILDKKLKERDDFIEAYAGGNDPNRAKRDDMIRGLPDIKALSAKRPVAVATEEESPAAVPVEEEAKKSNPGASAPPVLPQTQTTQPHSAAPQNLSPAPPTAPMEPLPPTGAPLVSPPPPAVAPPVDAAIPPAPPGGP